jgi:hypothetical protein
VGFNAAYSGESEQRFGTKVIDLKTPHQPQNNIIDFFIRFFCLKYTCMKCVCDADEVAVSNLNGWFHDNYVSCDFIII